MTMKPPPIPADLAILYSRKRDQAIGLPGPGKRARSLIDYRTRQRQSLAQGQRADVDKLARAAFLRAIIQESKTRAAELTDAAGTPEERAAALAEVQKLKALADEAAGQLEALENE